MRELPFPEDLLLLRDAAPILWVGAQTWDCLLCDPPLCKTCGAHKDEHSPPDRHQFERDLKAVATATVAWVGSEMGPHGRCSSCGQKFALAHALDKHIPSIDEQQASR